MQNFDIYKFKLEKYLRKEENTILKNQQLFFKNILKIHWIIVLMEGAVKDAFEVEQ